MVKKIIISPFFALAAVGSVICTIIHIGSLFNLHIFKDWLNFLIGFLFIIWPSVIIAAMAHGKQYSLSMKVNIHNYFGLDNFMYNCPAWMKYLALALWPYLLLLTTIGLLGFENGTFFLSGIILLFYINGFCILYSFIRNRS